MGQYSAPLNGFVKLARNQFWPFILFWLAVLLIRIHPMGGLLSAAFVNGEWAVQFWVKNGYSYIAAFSICAICANIDLAMWFWFFKKGRFLLEYIYPKTGKWFVSKFDPRQYEVTESDSKVVRRYKNLATWLAGVFGRKKYQGLFLMGFTPFCGIIVGVPTAVGYKVRYGYWVMALGNTVKILVFGFIITNKIILVGLLIFLAIWILFSKTKPR